MKKIIAVLLVAVIALFALTVCAPKNAVTIKVIRNDEVTLTKEYKTDLETLEALLVEKADELGATLIDSDYGKFVSGMDNYLASDEKHEFFEILVNDEAAQTGIAEIVIADGDVYTFRLSTY